MYTSVKNIKKDIREYSHEVLWKVDTWTDDDGEIHEIKSYKTFCTLRRPDGQPCDINIKDKDGMNRCVNLLQNRGYTYWEPSEVAEKEVAEKSAKMPPTKKQ